MSNATRPMLVDSHCHLDHARYTEDRQAVLERARAEGVATMLTIGTRLSTADNTIALAAADPGLYCSIGVHPHHAGDEPLADTAPLLDHADHPRVIGIGEAGLDYYYDHSPPEAQAVSFRLHMRAAHESGLPLIVHTRDADDDTVAMLRAGMAETPFAGVIHCYSSSPDLGYAALDLGLYLGIGGMLTFRRSEELRTTVRDVPLERLLLETDAPYLAPEPHRGRRNEPAHVARIAEVLAEVKAIDPDEIARSTTDNFFALFTKAKRP